MRRLAILVLAAIVVASLCLAGCKRGGASAGKGPQNPDKKHMKAAE
jgi:outer membrane murein-binding lipoprotein Lpp